MERTIHWLKAASAMLLMVAFEAAGQEINEPRATFFAPLDVPLVSVDVFVFDTGGRPVPGLTREDFDVFEDGNRVEVSHFYASPGIAARAERSGQTTAAEFSDQGPDQDLYLVVYFDDTNLNRGNRQAAIEHLRSFFSTELPLEMRVMVVRYDGRNIVQQPFTEENTEVLAALDSVDDAASLSREIDEGRLLREIEMAASLAAISGRMSDKLMETSGRTLWGSIETYVNQTVHRIRTGIENQKRLIGSLSGLSGRKAIVLVSDGVEARPGEALYRTWSQTFGGVPIFRTDAHRAFLQASRNDLSNDFDDLARCANGRRVSFYTLSPAGAARVRAVSAESRLMDDEGLTIDQGLSAEVLMAHMAGTTGGRPLVNSSALAEQLDQVSEELSNYYSLAFEPEHVGDGKYHRLEVDVKRSGLRIRHREGYVDVSPSQRMEDRTLAAAMHGISDNPLGISVANSGETVRRDDGTLLVPVIVTVPLKQLVLIPSEDEHQGRISIHLMVCDRRGDLSQPIRREYPVAIPNASLADALGKSAGFTMRLAVRPGWQRIAVGLRDEVSLTESTTVLEVEVGGSDGMESR
jgi:VWFA-related protein